MKITKFPLIPFTIAIITGIAINNYGKFSLNIILLSFILSISISIIIHIMANKKRQLKVLASISLIFSSIFIGMLLQYTSDSRHNERHYSHYISDKESHQYLLQINKKLKITTNYNNYIGYFIQIDSQSVNGKILIKQNKKQSTFKIGDQLIVLDNKSIFKSPTKMSNPYGFDYQNYLEKKQIYHQINLKNTAFKINHNNNNSLTKLAEDFRTKIKQLFIQNGLKGNNLSLAKALFLGERQDLSKKVNKTFQTAGTIHILAISGLHIGILLLFLNFIFKLVKLKFGNIAFLILTLSSLWMYAFITGFSPSVTRAVVMFSFVQIGLQLKRHTNIYNTIFVSILLMILINPNIIFAVGFQMSYAAVISIVSFYPLYAKRFNIKYKALKWITDIFVISLVAQLGVLPLSLYYFHQFPTYFFIANLLVIPLLFIILFYGFSLILLGLLGLKIQVLFNVFDYILLLMLRINQEIASLKFSIITNIHFSMLMLIILFVEIFILYKLLQNVKNYKYIFPFLICILLFQLIILVEKNNRFNTKKYLILQTYNHPLVVKIDHNQATFMQNGRKINPYIKQNFSWHFSKIQYDSLTIFQKYEHTKILHIDSLGIYQYTDYHPDIIHLSYSPKINLDRVISKLHPKIIVIDGSNYPSYIKRWKKSANKMNIHYFDTNAKGYFEIKK